MSPIERSKMALVLDEPFFANLALNLRYIEDKSIDTACTDGVVMRYSPDFIATLSPAQTTFVVCHEVLHCALGHVTRRQERDPLRWNMAADFVVNLILKQSNFTFPDGEAHTLADLQQRGQTNGKSKGKGYLLDPSLSDKSTEEVYAMLPEDIKAPEMIILVAACGEVSDPSSGKDGTGKNGKSQGKNGDGSGGGQDGDAEGPPQPQTASELDAHWQMVLTQAANIARGMGKLPGHIARMVDELLNPKLPWKQILRQFIRDVTVSDYTWMRPQRAALVLNDIILPSLKSEACGPIVVAVDTSGSVDGPLLTEFISELQGILDEAQPSTLTVLDCDAAIHSAIDYQPGDAIENRFAGGGGTDFRPVFDHVADSGQSPACLIYLTDMYGTFPDRDPGYPVLWISYSPEHSAPFGTVIEAR